MTEKGWVIEVSNTEYLYESAREWLMGSFTKQLEETNRELERHPWPRIRPNRQWLKAKRDEIRQTLYLLQIASYKPWVIAYPFRTTAVESWWGAGWTLGEMYKVLDLPHTTTTLTRCVELLKDIQAIQRGSTYRIKNVETKEEIPTDWIIEA